MESSRADAELTLADESNQIPPVSVTAILQFLIVLALTQDPKLCSDSINVGQCRSMSVNVCEFRSR
jgi:hypothetical protein